MNKKYTTAYFENDQQLYNEKFEFIYQDGNNKLPEMHIGFNINDAFFKPLGAEITSILETNKDIAFNFHVFVDRYADINKVNLQKQQKNINVIYVYI